MTIITPPVSLITISLVVLFPFARILHAQETPATDERNLVDNQYQKPTAKQVDEFSEVASHLHGYTSSSTIRRYYEAYQKGDSSALGFRKYMFIKYKTMRNVGISLVAVSGAMGITGVVLVGVGINKGFGSSLGESLSGLGGELSEEAKEQYDKDQREADNYMTAGLVIGLTGFALLPVSIVLAVKGNKRMHRLKSLLSNKKGELTSRRIEMLPTIDAQGKPNGLSIRTMF